MFYHTSARAMLPHFNRNLTFYLLTLGKLLANVKHAMQVSFESKLLKHKMWWVLLNFVKLSYWPLSQWIKQLFQYFNLFVWCLKQNKTKRTEQTIVVSSLVTVLHAQPNWRSRCCGGAEGDGEWKSEEGVGGPQTWAAPHQEWGMSCLCKENVLNYINIMVSEKFKVIEGSVVEIFIFFKFPPQS